MALATTPKPTCQKQRFQNGEVHSWYRLVLGYSDKLVARVLTDMHVPVGSTVLDPFCGSGTTLVECLKLGIHAVGVDANPAGCFATRVKCNWKVDVEELDSAIEEVAAYYEEKLLRRARFKTDPTFQYLDTNGLLDRGWISAKPLRKSIALKQSILALSVSSEIKDLIMLALISEVVQSASNVKFGPEIYCSKPKSDANVLQGLQGRIAEMRKDLIVARGYSPASCLVIQGDSRDLSVLDLKNRKVTAIITSPPYPTEHDYTRNTRLELAFLEEVTCKTSLRTIKNGMLRSHTKGIYKGDDDAVHMPELTIINQIVSEIEELSTGSSGFEKLYPSVVREYFGGMSRHLRSAFELLPSGSCAAYVVGDQNSYKRVRIPTAEVLRQIALEVGFHKASIDTWRSRWSTGTNSLVDENILIVRKP